MREDLLREIEMEYEQLRAENEREEAYRKAQILSGYPDIKQLVEQRENLVFDTLRDILNKKADTGMLPERMARLSSEIRKKLAENRFPEDYLSPVYRCALCQDTGYTGNPVKVPCACLKKAYQKKLRERIGLTAEPGTDFDHFDLSVFPSEKLPGRSYSQRELMERCREVCETWAAKYPDTEILDLLLSGKSGLGKTFLLRCMADLLIRRDINVLMISAYRLLEICRKSYFSNEDDSASDLMSADVLMIDDLGSEPLMQNVTVEQLFNVLNERRNRNLSTVISTNLDMNEFRNRYTERIASRLMDRHRCKILTLEGIDVRT